MGSKKGQLFLVAIVFLIGIIYVVQQSLFNYTSVEMSEPFENTDIVLFENIVNLVNETIRDTPSCNETKDSFEGKMSDLKLSLLREHGRAYSIDIVYEIDCFRWKNTPPSPAPLRMSVTVTGPGRDIRGTYEFYHVQNA